MYLKKTRSKQYTYLQVVESYRDDNGVPRHKVLFNLGRLDILKKDPSFATVIDKIREEISESTKPEFEDISDADVLNWGYKIYEKLWKMFELDKTLDDIQKNGKAKFDLKSSCFRMVIEHLLEPKSKLGVYANQDRYYNIPTVELQHFYRSLDILSEHKELLEDKLFYKNFSVFNLKVDIVFYDVTTFYFESVRSDSLREFGFSKDGKFNEVQIVFGLLVDMEGRPIGYELFPGNTFEGKTLEKALFKLNERFNLNKVIIVADRGLNSKINLKLIKDNGFDYIVASRLKSLPSDIQSEIFMDEGYNFIKSDEEDIFKYKSIDYKNKVSLGNGSVAVLDEKLIVTYSSKRSKKDKADRQRLIDKANHLLENESLIKSSFKRGGKKFLKEESSNKEKCYKLDEAAIEKDERFDGYYGIQTSETNLSEIDVIDAYHNLWKIEESFRIMKSKLEVRPIFHWTEKRIKGHFVVCFLAFLLERTLEHKLRTADIKASSRDVRSTINSMNFARFESKGQTYLLKTKFGSLGSHILRALRIPPPKNLSTPDELKF
ncbi:IS1634 family transposase [Deferribacterales bacterium Es71-Z0220]|uniref:IS1634 family transposase n=1 Tax=Deferrivibrio essentukiensis TaxID=2880922 RepID=UPI001F6209C0|nr:IS1634 family transposase [Deferrivibrio essentukiensis]MCB4205598.1 IS1634 family transposase [Deferrivibrio essentukiensis]